MSVEALTAGAQEFWCWFVSKETEIHPQEPLEEDTVEALRDRLRGIAPNVRVFIGSAVDGRREIVFSTWGDTSMIPAVEALGDTAPDLARWKIVKYQPRGKLLTFNFKGLSIDVEDVLYCMMMIKGRLMIMLFVDGAESFDNSEAIHSAKMLLYPMLGERAMLDHVEGYATLPMTHPRVADASPLPLLPDHFDWYIEGGDA